MAESTASTSATWATRWTFILAATGSAVGLGNIWKFPFITGEYGGGAFVLVYLLCVAFIGLPILMSEALIGRHARCNPITAMSNLAAESGKTRAWGLVGWMGVLAGFFILSFYSVVAGWALDYTLEIGRGTFNNVASGSTGKMFEDLIGDPKRLMIWHTLFMVITAFIIARGIHKGLENSVRIMMPTLFILLVVMVVYAVFKTDKFAEGLKFLFAFDMEKTFFTYEKVVDGAVTACKWAETGCDRVFTSKPLIAAMGHAFFTLSLGMGAIMAYGAYMPKQANIASTAITIVFFDTVVALLAGMAIFPIVFANGMEPSSGPGLLFISLPQAFGNMPFGQIFGCLFFFLVTIAALSSAISLIEPAVAYLTQRFSVGRVTATIGFSFLVWFLGIGSVLSFNEWADVKPFFGKTVFDFLDYLTANIMLPLGGMLIAIYAGWALKRSLVLNELALKNLLYFNLWRATSRVIAPVAVFVVFIVTLIQSL
ncbi:sodium-dependent transporter [Zooshikella sp. RANM57]|uniref:sodium-dependent transporter n=1 Tax=Zooshikella sp. RANM57 TaxID=3425863 RepID=UPI003D7007AF